ncbi:hypothetical protein ES703_94016 [subsurface metagenome]
MTHRSHINNCWILRIDDDPADVPGFLKTHIRPGFPAINRFIHAIPYCHTVSASGFSSADPDDLGLGLDDCDVADRDRVLLMEDGLPSNTVVL